MAAPPPSLPSRDASFTRSTQQVALSQIAACALERFDELRAIERLQQIVDSVDPECVDRVLLVSGEEDHCRHLLDANRMDHVESRQPRHPHVEEHEVRRELANRPYRIGAIRARRDDLDIRLLTEV